MSRTHLKRENEERTSWTDFTPKLNPGDTLTGTVTVTALPSAGAPPVTLEGRNSATQVVSGVVVAINKAAKFKVGAGGTVGTVYNYLVSVGTTLLDTVEWDFNVEVIADRP